MKDNYKSRIISNASGIILGMGSAIERGRYIVKSALIGWTHTQNGPCAMPLQLLTHWGLVTHIWTGL